MAENKNIIFKFAIFIVFLSLIISFIPFITYTFSAKKKMLYPPSFFIFLSDESLSGRDLCVRNETWNSYSGKRLKTKSQFAYLWLEFPPQKTEEKIIHIINKEQNYYTELLKPAKRGAITLYKQGDTIPVSKSPFKQGQTVFPLSLSGNEPISYILEIHDPGGVILEPDLINPDTWFSSKLSQKMALGFIIGIILILIFYCIYLSLVTKKNIHISFVFLLLSSFFLYAWKTRLLLEFIDPYIYPPWLLPVFLAINLEAFLFFIRETFKKSLTKTTTFAIYFLAVLILLCATLSLFTYSTYITVILKILLLSFPIIIIYTLFQGIRKKNIGVILTILPLLPLLVTGTVEYFTGFMNIEQTFLKDYRIILGIVFSVSIYPLLQKYLPKLYRPDAENIPIKDGVFINDFHVDTKRSEISVGSISLPEKICILEQKGHKEESTAHILRAIGYVPCILSNRLEVLEKASAETIDLLIIDYHPNIEETLSLCRLLRHHHFKSDLPILVIISYASNNLLREAMRSGVNDFLTLPFSNSEFISRVQSLLRLKAIARINTDLSRSESEKNTFLYFLTHNVNTPLTLLINRIQELSMENNALEMNEIIEDLEVSAGEIKDIVQNVLISFRISDNKHIVQKSNFNVYDILDRLQLVLLKKAQNKNQILEWIVPENIPLIYSDQIAIKGILYNLIDNAIKFTPAEGFIRVEVIVSDVLCIEVSDSGPGIEEQDIQNLFEPFQCLSSKPTGGESSTGLGLYVARELSLMSGAKLTCSYGDKLNIQYPGLKFILTLPLENI